MTSTTRSAPGGHRAREVALTVGAVVGALCLVATLAATVFGIKPLIFTSGSMSPAIGTGALALARTVPAADLEVGDIVSVPTADSRITHRIIDITAYGDGASLILQGDANEVPDAAPYLVAEADRVFVHVERLGYAVSWLSSPAAVFLGGIAVGALLMVALRRDKAAAPPGAASSERVEPAGMAQSPGSGEVADTADDGPTHRSHQAPVIGLVLALALAAAAGTPGGATGSQALFTQALFTDAGTAASGALTAVVVPAPIGVTCTVVGSSARISWAADANPGFGHVVVVTQPSNPANPPAMDVGTSDTVTVSPTPFSNRFASNITVTVRTYVRANSTWVSPLATTSLVLQGSSLRCS